MKDDMAVSQHFMAWTCGPSLNNHFLYYWLQSNKLEFERIAMGNTIKTIGLPYFRQLAVPLPANGEQEAIAKALSDADALIDSLKQLLAKKRQLKQGTMQELLTGKKRLPGFSGEWEVVNLDGVVDRISGLWGANDPSPDHHRCANVIRAGDVSQDGLLTGSAQRFLSDSEFSKACCRLDDIVITMSGNGLGKVWWCDGRPNVVASNFVRILWPLRRKSQGRYLSYVLRSDAGLKQLQENTATSAYPNLRPSFFVESWIPLPSIPEQSAIDTILSDMDAEIAALEARLVKAPRPQAGHDAGTAYGGRFAWYEHRGPTRTSHAEPRHWSVPRRTGLPLLGRLDRP